MEEKDASYFQKMAESSNGLILSATKPWKWAVIALVLAVTVCIVGWYFSLRYISNNYAESINRHMDTIDKLTEQLIK